MFPRLSRKSSKPSIGIKSWYTSKLSKNDNIFYIDTTLPQAIKDNHNSFNTFFNSEILDREALLLNHETYDRDNIISIHPYNDIDENDNKYLQDLKTTYTENYISTLPQTQKYPYFSKDLHMKNYLVYEKIEKAHGISIPIEQQSDEQFVSSLIQRVDGLKKCSEDIKETPERKTYYSNEYVIEKENLDILLSQPELVITDKIKNQCQKINWNDYASIKKEFDYKKFQLFLSNKLELGFAKTFLPDECFNSDGTINIDIIKQIVDSNNTNFRQYIFGFGSIVSSFIQYKPIFESRSMMTSLEGTYVCDKFINWNVFMNLFYNRCAMSNSDIFCPIRFILPEKDIFYINPSNKNDGIKIRYLKQINYLFDISKVKFIGVLVIKNIDDKTNNKKLMIKFIFKNLNKFNWDTMDTIKGIIPEYFIVNESMRTINEGSIIPHPNITFIELRNFMNMQKSKKITIYGSDLSNNVLFISNNNYRDTDKKNTIIKDLKLFEMEISDAEHQYFYLHKKIVSGGGYNNLKLKLKLQITKNEKILYNPNNNICGNYYNSFLNKVDTTIGIDFNKSSEYIDKFYFASQTLYDYLLLSNDEIKINKFFIERLNNKLLITKYIPISSKFYYYTEIFNKYNINITHKHKLLVIGYTITPIEFIKFNNYKINNINVVIPMIGIDSTKIMQKWNEYINIIKGIYNIQIIEYLDILYKLPILQIDNIDKKNDLVIYNIYDSDAYLYVYETYLNIPNIFIGALIGLKYTNIGGTFILNFGSVAYKQLADIYLILSQYFTEHHLYYPEVSNLFKRTGTIGIFKGYKGISDTEYNKLLDILKHIEKIYPNGSSDFNIYDPEIRKYFHINKSINTKLAEKHNNIIGFLDTKPNDPIYDNIRQFNDERYLKQDIYMSKLLIYLNKPLKELEQIKIPTQEQITNAILYCKKYDIPMFNKYSLTLQNNIITKTILHDMYGLHEPLLYKFKTPFQTHITDKISFNPKFKSLSRNKIKGSLLKTIHIIKNKSKTKQITQKQKQSGSFFNNLFTNDTNNNKSVKSVKYKSNKKSKTISKTKSSLTHKLLKHSNISLKDALFNSNNSLVQVGRLMDVRKDFTKINPNELYFNLKEQFRYYKAATPRNVKNLDKKVQYLLKDYSISQAWLKMYEAITDCNLIPTNRKGTYKSLHICEAPGTFINCINNYIHTKTQYNSYEWISQSLKPRGAKSKSDTISDTYGLIKRHPEQWDFGVDDTGDITNIDNIKHYAKIAKDMNVNLMTSDAGLPMGDPKYYQVAYASYVSILYSLPQNGTLLYKILSPIDIPLIWNLIYITYTNFKEMIFFKPVQNSQSREFYIIGKGYMGTDQSVLDKLLDLVPKFDDPKFNEGEYDLFNDTYPEEFVIQVQNICEKLASNYVNSIERIIYYVDNIDELGKDYQKHIESYMEEKNDDWIRKYKPIRLEKKFIL